VRPAVFLDRDGTLIEERGYLDRLDLLSVFPWTADALRLLKRAGFATVVITNQAAVARGIITEPFLLELHRELDARLARGGATVDRYYYCPHLVDAAVEAYRRPCRCRKPGPGMIEQACREMDLDPGRSVMVGDRWLDVACGRAAGTRALLVRTGHGAHEADVPHSPRGGDPGPQADAILDNLMEAAGWILRNSPR
jgi:D-glycero-D-manno-heptose 1,7-bisphosphate phosphatase